MKTPGQIILFAFPHMNLHTGKLRPALLLGKLPGQYGDWLICMISSQTGQAVAGFDEIVSAEDKDFVQSGLKVPSVIRVGRLAVVSEDILVGAIGQISPQRLTRIKHRLAHWLLGQ